MLWKLVEVILIMVHKLFIHIVLIEKYVLIGVDPVISEVTADEFLSAIGEHRRAVPNFKVKVVGGKEWVVVRG